MSAPRLSTIEYGVRVKANEWVWKEYDARRALVLAQLDTERRPAEAARLHAQLDALRRQVLACSRAVCLLDGCQSPPAVAAALRRVRAAHDAKLAELDALRREERRLVDLLLAPRRSRPGPPSR